MRGEPVFLGVYVKASEAENGGGTGQAVRWHAWGLPDGSFLLQEALPSETPGKKTPSQPGANVKRVGVDEFFAGYRVFAAFSSKSKPAFPHAKLAEQAALEPETPPASEAAAPEIPDGAHPDLVSYLTQGLGENLGKDYVLVKGSGRDEDELQASATIVFDEAPAQSAAPRKLPDAEDIAKIEQGFRTEFSLALIRLKSKRDDALKSLETLAKSDEPFVPEHKFMFSDCGLALRKRNLYVLASQFHERARELDPDDEHILFNLARVMYECGKLEQAREYLQQSIDMAPDFSAGRDFLSFIDGKMEPR